MTHDEGFFFGDFLAYATVHPEVDLAWLVTTSIARGHEEQPYIAAADAGVVDSDQDLVCIGNVRDRSVLEPSFPGTVKQTGEVLEEMVSSIPQILREIIYVHLVPCLVTVL